MTAEEALLWYGVGVGVMCGISAGPLLLVVLIRWAKSFLAC